MRRTLSRRTVLCLLAIVIAAFTAQAASSQAIVSWVGGSEFACFYGGTTGDVVGFRFQVTDLAAVDRLGVWNADTILSVASEDSPKDTTYTGSRVLDSDHEVGIWDDTQTLIASATVTPASPVDGDFRYETITPVVLSPGTTYTAGAQYNCTDNDNYISGASGLVTAPEVTWMNAVFPSVGNLGFVYPTEDSAPASQGRFGPNFDFVIVPVELQSFSIE